WRLPVYGAVITSSAYGKRYEMGHYVEGDTQLYVSRGLGLEGLAAPRARFLCPPEVVLVTLWKETCVSKMAAEIEQMGEEGGRDPAGHRSLRRTAKTAARPRRAQSRRPVAPSATFPLDVAVQREQFEESEV
ncbi:MAG: metallophosphoesterase, partial [Chloroflexi bacterium]|nr:metallophosphoesterase [Chloroflexota bacterium]